MNKFFLLFVILFGQNLFANQSCFELFAKPRYFQVDILELERQAQEVNVLVNQRKNLHQQDPRWFKSHRNPEKNPVKLGLLDRLAEIEKEIKDIHTSQELLSSIRAEARQIEIAKNEALPAEVKTWILNRLKQLRLTLEAEQKEKISVESSKTRFAEIQADLAVLLTGSNANSPAPNEKAFYDLRARVGRDLILLEKQPTVDANGDAVLLLNEFIQVATKTQQSLSTVVERFVAYRQWSREQQIIAPEWNKPLEHSQLVSLVETSFRATASITEVTSRLTELVNAALKEQKEAGFVIGNKSLVSLLEFQLTHRLTNPAQIMNAYARMYRESPMLLESTLTSLTRTYLTYPETSVSLVLRAYGELRHRLENYREATPIDYAHLVEVQYYLMATAEQMKTYIDQIMKFTGYDVSFYQAGRILIEVYEKSRAAGYKAGSGLSIDPRILENQTIWRQEAFPADLLP